MKNRSLWFAVGVFIILAGFFAITDLTISQRFVNPQSGWAHFLEAYGQVPGALVGFFGVSILFRLHNFNKSFKGIGGGIGLGILVLFTAFMVWGELLGQQVGADVNPVLNGALALLTAVGVQVWFRLVPDEKMDEYKTFGHISILLMFLAGVITVWAIKIPWGRWTYRDILEAGDLSLFTPWYLPQGINGHHSFISGHTALSFVILPIILLFHKDKTYNTIAWVLAITWGVLGAASRVVIGAHFASDVLFGGGQTLLWFWFLRKKYLKA